MLSLIDADIVCYRIGFTTENEDLPIAKARCDEMLDGILVDTGASEFKLFLSDNKENNFRYQIDPTYKANRIQPKPRWHEEIKEYLITKWGAEFAYGMEADDALGIAQTGQVDLDEDGCAFKGVIPITYTSVICSIDKDLRQIPGNHYNFVKKEKFYVTPKEGLRYFYGQLLIGDSGDNVVGCRGIGPVKAERILPTSFSSESELFRAVFNTYRLQHQTEKGGNWSDMRIEWHLLKIGRLLKIRQQQEEELWVFPNES